MKEELDVQELIEKFERVSRSFSKAAHIIARIHNAYPYILSECATQEDIDEIVE